MSIIIDASAYFFTITPVFTPAAVLPCLARLENDSNDAIHFHAACHTPSFLSEGMPGYVCIWQKW